MNTPASTPETPFPPPLQTRVPTGLDHFHTPLEAATRGGENGRRSTTVWHHLPAHRLAHRGPGRCGGTAGANTVCSALRRRRKTTAGVAVAAGSDGAAVGKGFSGGELRSGSGGNGKGGRRRRVPRRRIAGGSSRQAWVSEVDGVDVEAR